MKTMKIFKQIWKILTDLFCEVSNLSSRSRKDLKKEETNMIEDIFLLYEDFWNYDLDKF